MKIDFTTILNVPVFAVHENGLPWKRVYGATRDRKNKRWMFPAYNPFLPYVLHDLPCVCPDAEFTPTAQEWLDNILTEEAAQAQAEAHEYKGPHVPFEHQVAGVAELLRNHRWLLRWEMGTGKTRVPIDVLDELKLKALVLCPLIATDNWADEVHMHTDGTLTSRIMAGKSAQHKLDVMSYESDVDAFIVTYDTAKRYGIPTIYREAWKVFEDAGSYPTEALKATLRRTNSRTKQTEMAKNWVKGKPTRELTLEVKEAVGDTPQWLVDLNFQVAICDESHRFKSMETQRTKTILELVKHMPRRWWLTGTVSLGDPRDLYPQLRGLGRFLAPESYSDYVSNHVAFSTTHKHMVTGFKGIHLLNKRVNMCSSERRLLDCVDLPARKDINLMFELSPAQMRDYNSAIQEMVIETPDADPIELQHGAMRIAKLLQLCSGFLYNTKGDETCDGCAYLAQCVTESIAPGSRRCAKKDTVGAAATREVLRYPTNPKLQVLKELLRDLFEEQNNKVIVWATFQAEMDDIEALLKKLDVQYVRVDGSNTKDIKKHSTQFQTDPDCRVYLGQIRTGIAITITAAAYTVYYSRSWSLEDWEQSRGRNYRIGQKNPVTVYRLVARGSVEEKQLLALGNRRDLSRALTNVVSCLSCSKYSECVINGTQPWAEECVLSTSMPRVVAKTGIIRPKR